MKKTIGKFKTSQQRNNNKTTGLDWGRDFSLKLQDYALPFTFLGPFVYPSSVANPMFAFGFCKRVVSNK